MAYLLRALPIASSLFLLAAPALGQTSAQNEAQALALFKEALAAIEKNDYAVACPKFDAAMKLFPSPCRTCRRAQGAWRGPGFVGHVRAPGAVADGRRG
jgi:hypothetical protein